jgi:hypothetical protein
MKKILKKISLGLLGLGLLAACNGPKSSNALVSKKLEIKSPIPELDIKFEEFELDNSKDQVLKTKRGSQIRIPAGAIVDKAGKSAGTVKIKYREFHDAVDIFLSGIPMDYNAQGTKRNMQTAGMFELKAEKSGEELQVANGKTIGVRMASYEPGTDYSVFYLDQKGKGWEFLDYNSQVEVNGEKEKLKKSIEGKGPSMPFPLDDKYFAFDYWAILDAMFNDDYYKIKDNEKNPAIAAKAKKYGLMWLSTRCNEIITFKGVHQPAALMVWKRISGNPFPAWMKDENRDYNTLTHKGGNIYELSVEDNAGSKTYKATIECIMPISALFKFAPEYWEKNYKDAMAKVEAEMERLKMEADVFRSFEVSGFGIYNYDKLMKEDEAVKIIANFMPDESIKKGNETYDMDMVYYVPGDNKTLIKFPKADWGKVNLVPGNKGRFITVLPGAALGVYAAEKYMALDFEALRKKDNPTVDFVLLKTMDKASSADDIRKVLNF